MTGRAPKISARTVELWLAPALVLLLCLTPARDAVASTLQGSIVLNKGSGGKPSREVQTAQVYFTPQAAVDVEAPAEPFEIVTVRKEFLPRTLTVPVGSTVRFPNQDVILHNVFSVSGKNRFDLGLYKRGEGKSATFENPGIVRVFCNVHHSMVAYVLVVETPYTTSPDFGGRFQLDGLPDGPGTLTVWHERTEPYSRQITLPLTEPLEVKLEVSKPRVPRHTNKFGKPYARRRSGRSY
ncbi:MAG: hypothetical protein AAF657_26920 [Acidobacteriota bacterium]